MIPSRSHLRNSPSILAREANVTGRHISVRPNMPGQSPTKCRRESTNLSRALALGVKVRSTLAAAHLQASEGVLEDLLTAQELQDRQIDGRMEAQTTLVGAEGRVELHTVAAVDAAFALVVFPDDPAQVRTERQERSARALSCGFTVMLLLT